mmetsp:Transcript_17590/g.31763  ORF Transcript_17590/g.31763 Transcript_17590/m.31763 type:complete len:293 (-) Transcript_17590:71-949(-)
MENGVDDEVRAAAAPEEEHARAQEEANILRYCDIREFLVHLGVDPRVDPSSVVAAAHHMYSAPLPPHWTEHVDESTSRVYFFHQLQGEAAWSHPQETVFLELITEVRSWRPDEDLDSVAVKTDAYLRKAHKAAVEAIEQWTGPHDAPHGPEDAPESLESSSFYYNASTGESRWEDPRQLYEFGLRQRHAILCQCVAAHAQNLSKMAGISSRSSSVADPEEDVTRTDVAAKVQHIFESLGRLPLPLRLPQADAVPDLPPQGKASAASPAPGDETVRSQLSYLTARSESSSAVR